MSCPGTIYWLEGKIMQSNLEAVVTDLSFHRMKNLFEKINGITQANYIGANYEKMLDREERRDLGQFYTPNQIIDYIVSQLKIQKDSTICDPSCGCGSFLNRIFDIYSKKYGKSFIKNLFGVDINQESVGLTRYSLFSKVNFRTTFVKTIAKNISCGNSIYENKKLDAFTWKSKYPEIYQKGGFDFIVGNPPYISLKKNEDYDPNESNYSEILNGRVNAATLMIGKSLILLKKGGILAFLLPKSILFVDSYNNLRKYLKNNYQIKQIIDCGFQFNDVRGEQFILIVKKSTPSKKLVSKIGSLNKNRKLSSFSIKNDLMNGFDKFYMFDKKEHYHLINKIHQSGQSLNSYVDGKIFRGISVGGNKVGSEYGIHVIRGRDISKFKIKKLGKLENRFIIDKSSNKVDELKNKKIVIQNIFSSEAGIISASDDKGFITLDTVTNIVIGNNNKRKYILGILSSKLINYYLWYSMFNKSRLTMHVDKAYIGKIPIISKPNNKYFWNIIGNVDKALNGFGNSKIFMKKIDLIVYKLYKINEHERKIIEKSIGKMISSKSIW